MAQPWDKAQYDATYYGTPESYMHGTARGPGWPSSSDDGGRFGVVLHYGRWLTQLRAQAAGDPSWHERIAAVYNGIIGDNTATVLLVGSGFAYSLEYLIDVHGFPAANVLGVDTSDHIQGRKDATEEADIDQAITDAGAPAWIGTGPGDPNYEPTALTPFSGRGAEIKAWLLQRYGGTWGPYVRDDLRVLNESLRNQGSRNRVRRALGGTVDWAIFEFGLSSFTDAELTDDPDILQNIHDTKNGIGQVIYVVATTERLTDPKWDTFNKKTLAEWRAFLDADGWTSDVLIDGTTFAVL